MNSCIPFAETKNNKCAAGNNDCHKNALCIARGDNDFECICPGGYVDRSTNPVTRPGRICIPVSHECSNPSLNDCDSPDKADCFETEEAYICRYTLPPSLLPFLHSFFHSF